MPRNLEQEIKEKTPKTEKSERLKLQTKIVHDLVTPDQVHHFYNELKKKEKKTQKPTKKKIQSRVSSKNDSDSASIHMKIDERQK